MRFAKYHGLGNDFVLLDRLDGGEVLSAETVRALCDRHRGIGADGVLSIWPDDSCDARMQVQNADGSDAETCGNGLRCVARYLYDAGHVQVDQTQLTLRSGSGEHECVRVAPNLYRVSMGVPSWEHPDIPGRTATLQAAGESFEATCLVLGNPHAILFGDKDPFPLARRFGAALETHVSFAKRTNVSFVRAAQFGFEAVIHERGVGITQACGSGACAVAAAAVSNGAWPANADMRVSLPGGSLTILVDATGQIRQEGEAVRVFFGEVDLS